MKSESVVMGEVGLSLEDPGFFADLTRVQETCSDSNRIAVRSHSMRNIGLVLIAARNLGKVLFACPRAMGDAEVASLVRDHEIDLIFTDGPGASLTTDRIVTQDSAPILPGGRLILFSSGTTGRPKLAEHRWEAVQRASSFVGERLMRRRWLMCYEPTSFAATQVFFSAINSGGEVFFAGSNPIGAGAIASRNAVEVISATPTFWGIMVRGWPLGMAKPPLIQATLGGEIVPQESLDLIKKTFDPERLTHIYASTEAGSAIVVSDGLAGFSASLLEREGEISLRIREGCLEIRSSRGMEGFVGLTVPRDDEGWLATGDCVEREGERIYFKGRNDGKLNVGGRKVHPEEIEAAVCTLPGVSDCVVMGRPSPIVGTIIVAEVVLADGHILDVADFKRCLREVLEDFKVPQLVKQVDATRLSDNGKKIRRES